MDTRFDKELLEIRPPFFMLPWIGDDYLTTNVFFIGESDYDDGTSFHINWKREWIMKERILNIGSVRVLDGIERSILNNITNENRTKIWNSIAYTNLIQRPMNYNIVPKEKPNYTDFLLGWDTILQMILTLRPILIIKWGFKGDDIFRNLIQQKLYDVWKFSLIQNDNRVLHLYHESGYETKIIFVKHPSYPSAERKNKIQSFLNVINFTKFI